VALKAENVEDKASTSTTAHVHAPDAPDSFVRSAPQSQRPIVHPVPPSLSAKRKRDTEDDEGPSNFKRVRMIAKKRRRNTEAPGSDADPNKRKWEDEMDIDMSPTTKRLRPEDYPATSAAQSPSLEKEPTTTDDPNPETIPHNKDKGSPEPIKNSHWDRSPSDFNFNGLTNKDNPKTFSPSPMDDTQKPPQGRQASDSIRPPSSPPPKRPIKATAEDARRAGIPAGYSYKNWDPAEAPIMLLGSVFDAFSLGKWIYDWAVFWYEAASPLTEMVGELWLLLIQLSGKIKRSEEMLLKVRGTETAELVEGFLESGQRLWIRFAKLLKVCEDSMWKAAKKEAGGKKPVAVDKYGVLEFLDTILGREREIERTEKLMTGIRLWSLRFDANCDEILRSYSA